MNTIWRKICVIDYFALNVNFHAKNCNFKQIDQTESFSQVSAQNQTFLKVYYKFSYKLNCDYATLNHGYFRLQKLQINEKKLIK